MKANGTGDVIWYQMVPSYEVMIRELQLSIVVFFPKTLSPQSNLERKNKRETQIVEHATGYLTSAEDKVVKHKARLRNSQIRKTAVIQCNAVPEGGSWMKEEVSKNWWHLDKV